MALKEYIQRAGITLEYDAKIAPAHGLSSGGRIRILPGLAPAEEFSVLVHELAHEKLHHTDRLTEATKTVRETEAEAVAFVVSNSIGLDTNTAAADYIQLYNGDRQTLADSLHLIQCTAGGYKLNCVNGHRKDHTKETRWLSTSNSSTSCWRTTRSQKTS